MTQPDDVAVATGPDRFAPGCYRVRKAFDDLPCAHRTWAHDGRCRFLHGYERSFTIDFACDALDPVTGFVIDFGDLKDVRALLQHQFDHTTIVAADDPELPLFEQLAAREIVDLRVMDNPGMEGAARWVAIEVGALVGARTGGRVRVERVEARESRKNSVILEPAGPWTRGAVPPPG